MHLIYIHCCWHESECLSFVPASSSSTVSVATVMTNVFQKNGIMAPRKLAKIMRILMDIGHIKN